MANEHSVDEVVTKFFFNACRLRPLATGQGVQSALRCASLSTTRHPHDDEAEFIPLTTGSAAEFYIESMLPDVGDIDIMYHLTIELAIPRGQSPPTQLPAEFHNYVRVFDIIKSPAWLCVLRTTLLFVGMP